MTNAGSVQIGTIKQIGNGGTFSFGGISATLNLSSTWTLGVWGNSSLGLTNSVTGTVMEFELYYLN